MRFVRLSLENLNRISSWRDIGLLVCYFPSSRYHFPCFDNILHLFTWTASRIIFVVCNQIFSFYVRFFKSISSFCALRFPYKSMRHTHTHNWTQKNKFVKTNVERRKKDCRNSFLFVPCSCSALFKIIEMENHSSLKNHRFYLWLMNKREIKFKLFQFFFCSFCFPHWFFFLRSNTSCVFALLFAIHHSV